VYIPVSSSAGIFTIPGACSSRHLPSGLASGSLSPRANPREACRGDPRDITRDVPHRGRRILRPRPEVKRGQALQKGHCAAFGHPPSAIDHYVFPHSLRRIVTEEGQCHPRITPDVLHLLVHSQMAHHEFFALNFNPDYSDLRTAIGIERGQMSERSFFDYFTYCLRNLHGSSPLILTHVLGGPGRPPAPERRVRLRFTPAASRRWCRPAAFVSACQ
jgi:hypothetical protein